MDVAEWTKKMMKCRSIADRWNLFKEHYASSGGTGLSDPEFARKAELIFYAGASASWELMTKVVASLPDRDAERMMSTLDIEFAQFTVDQIEKWMIENMPAKGSQPS